ncbi:hypothetical protein [Azoarcus olearius]|uniref:Conserved hypothetical secreted protein n=1 Tax=Azoarcus sp. (strain BH72) TaxID=418699 RepID=A1K7H7_AZOSB|nr:hypothetical protein [Azoarcus olearius]ANQ85329.1 hypothetical protein dqs_2298 [Azoarcus olearius]CAL94782.1 conserved hypothetical secreted protein [Azoarcus olearius]
MPFFRRSPTRRLTGARLELAAGRQRLRQLFLVLGAVVLVTLAVLALNYFENHFSPARRVDQLERENATLREQGERDRLALEMEKATRAELEKQLGEVNDELKRLQAELVFYKSQGPARP